MNWVFVWHKQYYLKWHFTCFSNVEQWTCCNFFCGSRGAVQGKLPLWCHRGWAQFEIVTFFNNLMFEQYLKFETHWHVRDRKGLTKHLYWAILSNNNMCRASDLFRWHAPQKDRITCFCWSGLWKRCCFCWN